MVQRFSPCTVPTVLPILSETSCSCALGSHSSCRPAVSEQVHKADGLEVCQQNLYLCIALLQHKTTDVLKVRECSDHLLPGPLIGGSPR